MNLPNYSFLLVVVCFWLVYWLVNRQLVQPILALLGERERRIASGRAAFEQAKAALDQAMRERERELAQAAAEAQKERARLRAEGEQARRQLLERAREEGQARLAQFAAALEQEKAQAKEKLGRELPILARELAERLLGRGLAS